MLLIDPFHPECYFDELFDIFDPIIALSKNTMFWIFSLKKCHVKLNTTFQVLSQSYIPSLLLAAFEPCKLVENFNFNQLRMHKYIRSYLDLSGSGKNGESQ